MTCDVLQVVEFLLMLDLRAQKKKVQVARWQALTAFAQSAVGDSELSHRLVDYKNLQLVLRIASSERFGSSEIVAAMAQCVVVLALQSHLDQVNLLTVKLPAEEDGDFSYLALLKQIYVTLDDFAVRQEIVDALLTLIKSKEHVKATIRSGFLRSLLQVAIDDNKSKAAQRTADNETDEQEAKNENQAAVNSLSEDLMLNCAKALTHTAIFVCYESTPSEPTVTTGSLQDSEIADHSSELFVCELVVQLMLSGVSLVFEEGVRLLQMLVESQKLRSLLVTVMDLRGALEKASTLAQQKENKLRVQDPYLVMLCQQQYEQLQPEIDAYERANGVSLIGLPSDPDRFADTNGGFESVVTLATSCKERGNWFFRRGNFPTARVFYRRAVSLLRMAQLQKDQELATLSKQEVLRKCNAGASVQVLTLPRRVWKNAMVSDVEDGQVEVIFDDDESEEVVDPGRVRLRMATSILDTFEALEVDCSMNMGKAFSQLYDHERAVECFSHVLQLKRNHHVAALYHRGVAHMALHDLKSAQQDLWGANQLARKLGNEKALLKQIIAAYKRLQLLHSNKKKMDKKIIKQMMSYLSTIPGIQEEEES